MRMMGVVGFLLAAAVGAAAIYEGMSPVGVGLFSVVVGIIYIINDTGRMIEKMERMPRAAPLEGALDEVDNDIRKVMQELRVARSEIRLGGLPSVSSTSDWKSCTDRAI
jgi:hypothetical protein